MSQKPSVGRAVLFHVHPCGGPPIEPCAAVVTAINADGSSELTVFGRQRHFDRSTVRHRDDPDRPTTAHFWTCPDREELNLAFEGLVMLLAELQRRVDELEQVAHDHEGLVAASNTPTAKA